MSKQQNEEQVQEQRATYIMATVAGQTYGSGNFSFLAIYLITNLIDSFMWFHDTGDTRGSNVADKWLKLSTPTAAVRRATLDVHGQCMSHYRMKVNITMRAFNTICIVSKKMLAHCSSPTHLKKAVMA